MTRSGKAHSRYSQAAYTNQGLQQWKQLLQGSNQCPQPWFTCLAAFLASRYLNFYRLVYLLNRYQAYDFIPEAAFGKQQQIMQIPRQTSSQWAQSARPWLSALVLLQSICTPVIRLSGLLSSDSSNSHGRLDKYHLWLQKPQSALSLLHSSAPSPSRKHAISSTPQLCPWQYQCITASATSSIGRFGASTLARQWYRTSTVDNLPFLSYPNLPTSCAKSIMFEGTPTCTIS